MLMEFIHSEIWWLASLKFIDDIFTKPRAHKLQWKRIQHVGDIQDIENYTFIMGNEAQIKSNPVVLDTYDMTFPITKIMNLWRHRLESDSYVTHPRQWVRF